MIKISASMADIDATKMSLLNKIENIQKKPERIKKRILFISVSLIMFAVMAVWISTLNVSLGGDTGSSEAKISSPISVFKEIIEESAVAGFAGIKDSFAKIKEVTSSSVSDADANENNEQ